MPTTCLALLPCAPWLHLSRNRFCLPLSLLFGCVPFLLCRNLSLRDFWRRFMGCRRGMTFVDATVAHGGSAGIKSPAGRIDAGIQEGQEKSSFPLSSCVHPADGFEPRLRGSLGGLVLTYVRLRGPRDTTPNARSPGVFPTAFWLEPFVVAVTAIISGS